MSTVTLPKPQKQRAAQVDPRLYHRTPQSIAHDKSYPNDIYIRSQRSTAPLSKRLKFLFFDANAKEVYIHATGKNIPLAIKLALNFSQDYFPFFSTTTTTSTETVTDYYTPILERDNISAQFNTNDGASSLQRSHEGGDEFSDEFSDITNLNYIAQNMLPITMEYPEMRNTQLFTCNNEIFDQYNISTGEINGSIRKIDENIDKKHAKNSNNKSISVQSVPKKTAAGIKRKQPPSSINANGNTPLPPPPILPNIAPSVVKKTREITTGNEKPDIIEHVNKKQKISHITIAQPSNVSSTTSTNILDILDTIYTSPQHQPIQQDDSSVQLTPHSYDPQTNTTYITNGDVATGHVLPNGQSMSITKLVNQYGVLQPFQRQRLVSSIHITLHKTAYGDKYVL